jgi:hypothetical protein
MTQRTHFWLRIVGLSVILAAEFGPRIWNGVVLTAPATVAAASNTR